MLKRISLVVACFAALFLPNGARASEWDRMTTVTFSAPVDISGVVLPAGTYVFKMADTSMRNVVQVFNADQDHVFATILGIPNQANKIADKTRIRLDERPAGEPPAIQDWYYPGRIDGLEFKHR